MSSTSELSSFAACLRESILASEWQAPGTERTPLPALSPQCGERAAKGRERGGSSEADFEALALQLFALQFEHNAPYRRWCEARGARPGTVEHWTAIPAAPTSAFKEFDLSCLRPGERTTVFHSSGTTGQKPSRHFHNAGSLALYEASLLRWFEEHCPLPIAHCQLAILTPRPAEAPHSSLAHMFETIRRAARWEGPAFVGRAAQDGVWTLDTEAALARLRAATGSGQPLLLLGTAFSYVHLLDDLAGQDLRFELPPGSCALETGGYKGRSRSLPKAALHALISERLGLPPGRIVCEYGMSELSSQAYDSALAPSLNLSSGMVRTRSTASLTSPGMNGTRWNASLPCTPPAPRIFTFPPWARVQVISPETGGEVAEGETGLIRVFDLANVYSVMAIQTEDLGIRRGDGFALAGRAVLAEPRGCSLLAV